MPKISFIKFVSFNASLYEFSFDFFGFVKLSREFNACFVHSILPLPTRCIL